MSCLSICMSVHMHQLRSCWTEFCEIWWWSVFQKSVKKIQVSLKSEKDNGTLHEDQYRFLIMSCWIYLRMRNVADKRCREYQNTHFIVDNFFFNRTFYEIMWKNMADPDRAQMTIWHMHIACWIPKATNTRSEYLVLIALPQQKWLHKQCCIICTLNKRWEKFRQTQQW